MSSQSITYLKFGAATVVIMLLLGYLAYTGGFGVATKKDGKAVLDEVTVRALGLNIPAAQR